MEFKAAKATVGPFQPNGYESLLQASQNISCSEGLIVATQIVGYPEIGIYRAFGNERPILVINSETREPDWDKSSVKEGTPEAELLLAASKYVNLDDHE